MDHYKEINVPATTKKVIIKTTCDLCGRDLDNSKQKRKWFLQSKEVCTFTEAIDKVAEVFKTPGLDDIYKQIDEYIHYDSSLQKTEANKETTYEIIRSSTNDGTLLFYYQLLSRVLNLVLEKRSYHILYRDEWLKENSEDDLYRVCYDVGQIRITNEYDDPESPMCQRCVVKMPVRCYYMRNGDEYREWVNRGVIY